MESQVLKEKRGMGWQSLPAPAVLPINKSSQSKGGSRSKPSWPECTDPTLGLPAWKVRDRSVPTQKVTEELNVPLWWLVTQAKGRKKETS